MQDYLDIEKSKQPEESLARRPTLALRLALSIFGSPPQLGFVPMRFFAEEDIQVYVGLPTHSLNRLVRITGETTAGKIVQRVFPRHQEQDLHPEVRYLPETSLPDELKAWLEPVPGIIKKIKEDRWNPPPINVLNFRQGDKVPWIIRAEHLCGQIPDGTHRALALAILATDIPDALVCVRILSIHPLALAVINSLTLPLRFCLDPLGTPNFIQKRFTGSANFFNQTSEFKNE